MSRWVVVVPLSCLLAATFGVGSAQSSSVPTLTLAHGSLAPLPTISPPPVLHRPMRWALMPHVVRSLSSAATYVRGEAIIGYTAGADLAQLVSDLGVTVATRLPGLNAAAISGTPTALAAIAVRNDPRVRYIEPIQHFQIDHQRNDPLSYQLDPASGLPWEWAFTSLGVDKALNITPGDPQILVGDIDTGYSNVPDEQSKIAGSWYFTNQGANAFDTNGHGTFVASVIAAPNDDGFGLAGYCGQCRVVAFRDTELSQFSVAAAIRKLTDEHVRIINMSFGATGISYLEADALQYAINAGVLLVASSGNDSSSSVSYPAAYLQNANGVPSYGLAVGASYGNGGRTDFSNYGANLSLVAPGAAAASDFGAAIVGAIPQPASEFDGSSPEFNDAQGNRYAYGSGTSFSSPEVAGIAALVWAANPLLKNYEVANILKQTATRPSGVWDPQVGWGVVNAAAAVEQAAGRPSADSVTLGSVSYTGRKTVGSIDSATTAVTWQDGTSIMAGTTSCAIHIGGRNVSVTAAYRGGVASCSWAIPRGAAGKTGSGKLTASDKVGNQASATFVLRVAVAPKLKKK